MKYSLIVSILCLIATIFSIVYFLCGSRRLKGMNLAVVVLCLLGFVISGIIFVTMEIKPSLKSETHRPPLGADRDNP
jgi:uncharacterized membrane protein YqjE